MYPDYDFSTLRAEHFQKAASGANRLHGGNSSNNNHANTITIQHSNSNAQQRSGSYGFDNNIYAKMSTHKNTNPFGSASGVGSIASVKERVNMMLNDAARAWDNAGPRYIHS